MIGYLAEHLVRQRDKFTSAFGCLALFSLLGSSVVSIYLRAPRN